jgi:hypothetical protein
MPQLLGLSDKDFTEAIIKKLQQLSSPERNEKTQTLSNKLKL